MMLTPTVKRKVIVGFAVVLVLAAIALTVVCSWPIKVLDARFHVISVTASRGTNQTIYVGNQLTGRVRENLRKLGLGGNPPQKVSITLRDRAYVSISVVYAGDLTRQQLEAVDADLVDSTGKVIRLNEGFHAPDPKGTNYLGTWIQRLESTNTLNYHLRLNLQNNGGQLAEIKLGKL